MEFKMNIQLFADGAPMGDAGAGGTMGGDAGGITPQGQVATNGGVSPTNPIPAEPGIVNPDGTTLPIPEPKPQTDVNDGAGDGEPQIKPFDPLTDNLSDQALMQNFDFTPYEDLAQNGINVHIPDFVKLIDDMQSLGINDPQVQKNIIERLRQEHIAEQQEANKSPEQIRANLIKSLPKDVMGRYNETANILKSALNGSPMSEFFQNIMTDPEAVMIADAVIQYIRPQMPKNSFATAQMPASTLSANQAIEQANRKIADEIIKSGTCTNEKRNAILKEIASRMAGKELAKFKDRYSL